MRRMIGKALVPAILLLLTIWRAMAIDSQPWAFPSGQLKRPRDLAIKTEVASIMASPWSRPLFSRPTPANVALSSSPASEIVDEPARLPRLVGIVTDGERRLAVLALNGRLLRSERGATVGPSTIRSIDLRSVTLDTGGERRVIFLDKND